ncbi:acetyl-CoA C-acyltransferase [Brumimicrobium glaciale]|uniref:acetyl-CoA C-acyltransferase n=1 Tax=Brumimicrobium glaciale TaxID=200475 RepID=A0A4Q4KQK2_9FLAO|nr:acetyl-CoA C-acyltransferase [Brumimicrobium glaciale]RYM34864.1 acetyl-CoA C-acyltransferase [Brumimicrobium glaciale]
MSKEVYIVDGVRTPIGSFRGALSNVRPDDMAALVMKTVVERNSTLDPNAIEDVIFGCANQAGEDNRNVARMSLLLAGLPSSIGGETINRLCASGLSAIVTAARAIKDGAGDIYLAGGVENMTRGPWVMSKSAVPFGSDAKLYDSSFGWRFVNPKLDQVYGTEGMGQTAENLVAKYGVSREDQDKFAAWSQQKAEAAWSNGRLAEEIVAVEIPRRKQDALIFDKDEFFRPGTTVETLSKLRPAFKKEGGSVTAGNSSGLNDGAGAILLSSEQGLKDHQLKPMARFIGAAVAGVEPRIMGIGPVYAANKLLKRTGLTMDDMDIIELNEAFAAQALSCTRAWGLADNDPRLNPNGGAIALGHPLGMTGSRILQTAAIQLQKTQKRYALITLCIGVGQGYAAIIERV